MPMKTCKTEPRNIEIVPAIVNGLPARISTIKLTAKGRPYDYFRLTWYSTDGVRVMRSYPSRKAAESALSKLTQENSVETERQKIIRNRIGEMGKKLDNKRLWDAAQALELLPGRASLVQAVTEYVERHPVGPTESVEETCARYITAMQEQGARESSVVDKRVKFRVLCRDLGKTPTLLLDEQTAEAWLKKRGCTRATAKSYGTAIKNLVNFYAGKKRKRHLNDERLPETWTVAKVRQLFVVAEAKVPEIIPAMVVLWFGGVRPEEMLRLSWENIQLSAKSVHVPPEVAKTRTSRVVDIGDNAVEWLMKYKGEGPLVSSHATYRRLRSRLQTELKMNEWPRDCPRHTYATMLYKSTENLNRTMEQLGHFGSSSVFVRHYKGQHVTREQAAEYFNIRPGGIADPIPIKTAETKAAIS
jgi:integrase